MGLGFRGFGGFPGQGLGFDDTRKAEFSLLSSWSGSFIILLVLQCRGLNN